MMINYNFCFTCIFSKKTKLLIFNQRFLCSITTVGVVILNILLCFFLVLLTNQFVTNQKIREIIMFNIGTHKK